MVTAYLIAGAESNGTRLMTHILVDAGCLGTSGHIQPFDTQLPAAQLPIVWRRSFPHAQRWPDLPRMATLLRDKGYTVRAVWMVRDWWPCARSQVWVGHVATLEEAYTNIRQAMRSIPAGLGAAEISFEVVTYAGLARRPHDVLAWLMPRLGQPVPEAEIYDGDEKWWAGLPVGERARCRA